MESGRRDSDSAEVNGSVKETPVATYKSLPDDDAEWKPKSRENSMMGKQNGDNEIDDGAQEQMLKNQSKITPTKNAPEVKFISENGDAKIDIETVKQAFSGMGKEELMKFANDPFWIRLRWLLFIAFWTLWFAMLAGAVAIIVMAPKCSAPQEKKWFEESPIIQLDASETPNYLKDFEHLLDELKDKNIKAISLASILKESSKGHTEDFKDINPNVGHVSDLQAFVKAAKDRNQHIILELDPNHSSLDHPWFKRSVKKEEPYTSYYVWSDGKIGADGKPTPPNNWLSVYGGSAWEWNDERGQYYLHQFNKTQPDLNFNNEAVISEFGDILTHWLKLGIDGFRLSDTQYLTEDPNVPDEHPSHRPSEADDYQSLVHVHTRNRAQTATVLAKWQGIVHNETKGEGLFALKDDIGADILEVFNDKTTLIDLPQSSQFLTTADDSISAMTLNTNISHWLNISSWPGWDLHGKDHSLRKRMHPDVASSVMLMTLLLPGTPILKLNDTREAEGAFTILSKARSGKTFQYGETLTKTVGETFVYTRLKSGNPGYLVAYHSGTEPVVLNLSVIPQVSDEVNVLTYSPNYVQNGDSVKTKLSSNVVLTYSPNYVQNGDSVKTKLSSNSVPMSPKSTLVLTFIPKQ